MKKIILILLFLAGIALIVFGHNLLVGFVINIIVTYLYLRREY